MKKILLTILIIISPIILFSGVKTFALSPTLDPEEVIFDYECQRRTLLSVDTTSKEPKCNLYCIRKEIFSTDGNRNDDFCPYKLTTGAKPGSEIFGDYEVIEFFIPQEDAALIYLRSGLYVVMGLAGLLLILYGLYGWYIRSMSAGNPDKVQLSMSIFKNALIGGVMVVIAVVIVQMIYSFLGITQGAFDFNFIPKIGTTVTINDIDVGRKCYSNQTDTNGHSCVDGKWE
jgi:hypothetical protein